MPLPAVRKVKHLHASGDCVDPKDSRPLLATEMHYTHEQLVSADLLGIGVVLLIVDHAAPRFCWAADAAARTSSTDRPGLGVTITVPASVLILTGLAAAARRPPP